MAFYDQYWFEFASIVGGVAFALSGFLAASRRHLDLMGIFVLAFLVSNGGGVVRDLLVDRTPAILRSMLPFWLTTATVALAALFRLQTRDALERNRLFILSDAIGLAAFGITGAFVGIEEDLHFFGVVTLSFLTATGGGILRDVLINELPLVLHDDFYGSVAIALGIAVYTLHSTNTLNPITLLLVFLAGLALRLLAHKRRWKLPKLTSNSTH